LKDVLNALDIVNVHVRKIISAGRAAALKRKLKVSVAIESFKTFRDRIAGNGLVHGRRNTVEQRRILDLFHERRVDPDGQAILLHANHKADKWFNPNAFLAPANTAANGEFYGNVGRNSLIGPGLATWDFSVLKDTRIRERLSLQFRAEIFNLLNRANFNLPNAVLFTPSGSSPTAGVIYQHVHYVAPSPIRCEAILVIDRGVRSSAEPQKK
jgi:hypothetical protein